MTPILFSVAIQCPFMGKCMFVTVKLLHGYLCFMKGVTLMATENKMGVMPLKPASDLHVRADDDLHARPGTL